MKTPDFNPPQSPEVYSLSADDFKKPPAQIVEYKVADRVTRENFISFFITSFAVSRGKPGIQLAFLKWLRRYYGFDYKTTLQAFSDCDGWGLLSNEERYKFKKAFEGVKKHSEENADKPTVYEINSQINVVLGFDDPNRSDNILINLDNIKTFSEFNKQVIEYLKAERERIQE